MLQFLRQKGAQYVTLLLLTLILNFLLPRLMPGTPLQYLAGEDVGSLTPEARAAILAKHHLDKPLHVQFLYYLKSLARLDFGYSYQKARPISSIIAERLPWTLLLTSTALITSTLIGVVLGAFAAWRRGKRSDLTALVVFIALESLPSFWVGMMLIAIFAAGLKWFPVYGAITPYTSLSGFALVVDVLHHLALPLLTLTIIGVSGNFMVMRYSMLSVLKEDYILMARAKGLPDRVILYRHAMRNALLPLATVFILNLGFLVGGATVVETVFSFPGVGRLMFESVLGRDYPVLQATFLITTVSVLFMNLVADLVYPLLDPRVARPQEN